MPTFDKLPEFLHDWATLTDTQKRQFMNAVAKMVADLKRGQGFRAGLRIKGVQGNAGVFEMTWADDGRATFSYGSSPIPGEPHIIWRRVGSHDIFQQP
ncbi:MAG TPA: hypothetical protein VH349_01820 [Ktedonobacterales bacterium]|jgi:hypothetical protein